VKTGAPELKGTYKIKGDRIELVPKKGKTLDGMMQGDSIIVKGLPPLVKQWTN
jgi:hypothetical protein